MFEKISKRKMKGLMLWKYVFQLVMIPLIYGAMLVVIGIISETITHDFQYALYDMLIKIHGITDHIGAPGWLMAIMVAFLINLLNVLSVVPFIKLLIDCMSKADEETKEIEVYNILPPYELQSIRQSKRFMSDTFSRKKNIEMFIYDENKTKYRFFWNENYGDKIEESKIHQAKRMRISYFKHSKIIFRCEILESEQY